MGWFIFHRLLALIPVLLVVSIVVFCLVHLAPGDPVLVILGNDASPGDVAALRQQMGLDQPLLTQFVVWFSAVLRGDLGRSLFMNASVMSLFLQHLQPTLALALYAQGLALLLGLAAGVLSASQQGRLLDRVIMGLAAVGMSIPGFLLGLFLIFFFAVQLRWFPVVGYSSTRGDVLVNLWYMTLPALALGLRIAALIARMTRAVMLDVLSENYIKTARAKGVSEYRVLLRHGLKNALLPILTICGESFGSLVTGTIVIESVFGIPGVGSLVVDSIERRDFSVIQGAVLLITISYVLINLAVDILGHAVDPRISLSGEKE
ncbi:ABC transporter permease [Pectobacterium brasiliense]|uniref:Peptide ABC transporter n=1 Tax=Pectobacterium brasiliense TaxID=180957 RepID=A0A0M2F0X3_9GAMM|nr:MULTISPECIES: ABC transporter permease [Pectobacterium]KGA23554.1 peptide ABC transporter [Pectobacterium brasiliense]KGA33086.1 peptide ABC transporter [Pectobacterium brasiliense]KRF64243.1 peptide ABC transporter [Pectobacterium brasiliense]MBN3187299.1 ABC transporter permease [Pectobacterium brasiliense]MCG5047454.1 ABC transporter permease [Pectobacterium brasiliense]